MTTGKTRNKADDTPVTAPTEPKKEGTNDYRRIHDRIEKDPTAGRKFFRALFEQASHAICVTDLARNVIMANRELENLTGFSEDELLGQSIKILYPDDFHEDLDLAALRQGDSINLNFRINKKRRGDVPIKARYALTPGIDGQDVIVETYSDLSDRLRVDQLKNEFVFVAAHELRNPVTAIKLLVDIIFDDKRLAIDPILRDYLLKIKEANERLSHLVDDLLEVSRTESNRLKITVSPQNMADHVNATLNDQRPTAVTKDVSLRYAPAPKMPLVLADSMKLKEILTNLVSNAIKYNVTGGNVHISHDVRGKMMYTTIADTGIGIKSDDQRRLFEKFWRSEDLAVRAQAGTGLGLFIVRELVRRMNGRISAVSKPGKGTIFTFALPIVK